MANTAKSRLDERAAAAARQRARGRAEQAAIVIALRRILGPNEQLMAFGRGRISGGWKGKLAVGPESFFAPVVNIALTDRSFILQHIQGETAEPSSIIPHNIPLDEIVDLVYSDVETFSEQVACRLSLRLNNEQTVRVRLSGEHNIAGARALAEVYRALTTARRAATASPTTCVCSNCKRVLEHEHRFCPHCGAPLSTAQPAATGPAPAPVPDAEPESPAPGAQAGVPDPEMGAPEESVDELAAELPPADVEPAETAEFSTHQEEPGGESHQNWLTVECASDAAPVETEHESVPVEVERAPDSADDSDLSSAALADAIAALEALAAAVTPQSAPVSGAAGADVNSGKEQTDGTAS